MNRHSAKLSEICQLLALDYEGSDIIINNLNLANRESEYTSVLSYLTSLEFCNAVVKNNSVTAIVVPFSLKEDVLAFMNSNHRELSYIYSDNAEYTFYDIHNALYKLSDFYDRYDIPAIAGENCDIAESAVIETGVKIGNNVTIGPNSVVRKGSIIEDDVTIGCCSVIGSEGFQAIKVYRQKIKHVGICHIAKGANIGDNTTICNALFEGETYIGEYTNIDNHVQVAHNCKVGNNCVITASCTMMGTTELEDNVWLAPNSVILNKKKVGEGSFVGTFTFVNRNLKPNSTVFGIPAKKIEL